MSELVEFKAKKSDFAAWYEQILVAADLLDKRYPVKGMPVWKSAGWFMQEKIMRLVEEQWEEQDIEKCQFPLCIPETFLKKEEDHVAGFEKECFWVTKGGLNELDVRLALRPTSETAMYSMFSLWIRSHSDLPLKLHQTCQVFRHETKNTKPLIRVREIYWNEAHTAHATAEDAAENLVKAWHGYRTVFKDQLGFWGLVLRRPVWDKFAGSLYTEVLDTIMPCGRVLQTVGAHNLGTKFAKVFNIQYQTEDNKPEDVHMTCYGVSTRVLAAAISIHGDDKGLVLPSALSKIQVVIIPIQAPQNYIKRKAKQQTDPAVKEEMLANEKELLAGIRQTVADSAAELARTLKRAGIKAHIDDRDAKPGFKYNHWELRGVPVRLEVGPRDVDCEADARMCRLCPRVMRSEDGLDKKDILQADLVEEVLGMNERLLASLWKAAEVHNSTHITKCSTIAEVKDVMDTVGGFAKIPFCSMDEDGADAEAVIREATGGEVRGYCPDETEVLPAGTMCLGDPTREAKYWGFVARSY